MLSLFLNMMFPISFIAISMKTVKLGHGLISTYVADHVISATYSIYAVLVCVC